MPKDISETEYIIWNNYSKFILLTLSWRINYFAGGCGRVLTRQLEMSEGQLIDGKWSEVSIVDGIGRHGEGQMKRYWSTQPARGLMYAFRGRSPDRKCLNGYEVGCKFSCPHWESERLIKWPQCPEGMSDHRIGNEVGRLRFPRGWDSIVLLIFWLHYENGSIRS